MLHEFESTEETQSFLKENGKKFSQDCITAMKLMYQGVRLNGETCKQLYGLHDRRLRDCFAGRPDIVKRVWVKDTEGKRKYVEYFIPQQVPPTKQKAVEWATKFLEKQQPNVQPTLF